MAKNSDISSLPNEFRSKLIGVSGEIAKLVSGEFEAARIAHLEGELTMTQYSLFCDLMESRIVKALQASR